MADNYLATQGAGTTFAADDISSVLYPRVKLAWGADGAATDVSAASPLPVEGAKTAATLYALTLTNANTEYSQALPATCRAVSFKSRSGVTIRYAWATGKVATPTDPYQTLPANCAYSIDGVKLASATLYFASATAGTIVEIEAWG